MEMQPVRHEVVSVTEYGRDETVQVLVQTPSGMRYVGLGWWQEAMKRAEALTEDGE